MAVTMKGFRPANQQYTLLSDTTAGGAAVIGENDMLKPVKLSGANEVTLCSDGDIILGLVDQVRDLTSQAQGTQVTVAFTFGEEVEYDGDLAVGDLVVAAGSGKVRAVANADTIPAGVVLPRVFEISDSTNKKAIIFKA